MCAEAFEQAVEFEEVEVETEADRCQRRRGARRGGRRSPPRLPAAPSRAGEGARRAPGRFRTAPLMAAFQARCKRFSGRLSVSGARDTNRAQLRSCEFCAVHRARTLDQVVRLVHQHRDAPWVQRGEAVQQRAGVEIVVVVAHHDVAPAHQFLAQVVGADLVCQRNVTQRQLGQWCGRQRRHGRITRLRQTVVEAVRERARRTMALLVGVFAAFFACHQFQHAQRQRRHAGAYRSQRIERQAPARTFGGEEEHLVELLRRARLEHRKDRGDRLADAGGRLRHQAAPAPRRAEHGFGQASLAGAKRWVHETQLGERGVALGAVRHFAVGPEQKTLAQVFEEAPQIPLRCIAASEHVPARCRCRNTPATQRVRAARIHGTAASRRPSPVPSAAGGGWRGWR